jgi:PAT family acetyl-CoA transporter-like MFS transporter 1
VFFLLWLLTATQDIAVDGWALTMMQRRNIGYLATINCVGQSFGMLLGFVVFLTLESKDFCNKYIFSEPREEGLVKFSGFLQFWGIAILTVTIGIVLFKRESSEDEEELKAHPDFGIDRAYPILWRILKKKPVLLIIALLFTADISYASVEVITNLKLIDYGIPKDKIALFNIPSFAVQLLLPILVTKYTAGNSPMAFWIKAFPCRLIASVAIAAFVYATPMMFKGKFHDIPMSYYAGFMGIFFLYQVS